MKNHVGDEFFGHYDRHADAIFRHCYFRLRDRERAKDMTQETFMKAWEYVASGKSVGNMRPFLYKIATNLIIDESRKKRELSLENLSEGGFEAGVKNTDEKEMDVQLALKIIDELPEGDRELMTMRYVDELSIKEIAEALGKTENAVSVALHRAMKNIQNNYGN